MQREKIIGQGIPAISMAHNRIISLIVDDDIPSKYSWDQKLKFSESGSYFFIVKNVKRNNKDFLQTYIL